MRSRHALPTRPERPCIRKRRTRSKQCPHMHLRAATQQILSHSRLPSLRAGAPQRCALHAPAGAPGPDVKYGGAFLPNEDALRQHLRLGLRAQIHGVRLERAFDAVGGQLDEIDRWQQRNASWRFSTVPGVRAACAAGLLQVCRQTTESTTASSNPLACRQDAATRSSLLHTTNARQQARLSSSFATKNHSAQSKWSHFAQIQSVPVDSSRTEEISLQHKGCVRCFAMDANEFTKVRAMRFEEET